MTKKVARRGTIVQVFATIPIFKNLVSFVIMQKRVAQAVGVQYGAAHVELKATHCRRYQEKEDISQRRLEKLNEFNWKKTADVYQAVLK